MAEKCLELLCSAVKEQKVACVIGGFVKVDGNGKEYKIHVAAENANKWIYIWCHAQMRCMDLVREYKL